MKLTSTNSTPRLVLLVIIAIAGLFLYVGAYVINVNTLVAMWIMPAMAAAITIATIPLLARRWRWLTGRDRQLYNILCHIYVTGALAYFAIAGGNYFFADSSTAVTEQAHRDRPPHTTRDTSPPNRPRTPHQERHHHNLLYNPASHRRHRTRHAGHRQEYSHTRTGQQRTLTLQRGLLGFTVIKKKIE